MVKRKRYMFRKGLFTESTFKKLWEKNHDLKHDLFLRYLLHLNIIAELPVTRSGDRKFFMPSALVCAPSDMHEEV